MQHWQYCGRKIDRNEISSNFIVDIKEKRPVDIKEILVLNRNNIVLIGPAMVGKTRMIKKINEKFLETKFKLVFYIDLELLTTTKKISCLRFLTSNRKLTKDIKDETSCEKIMDYIRGVEENVLLVFDHLDKIDLLNANEYELMGPFDASTPNNFVRNIIHGELFNKAKKLFLSRPYNLEWVYIPAFQPIIYNVSARNIEIKNIFLKELSNDKQDFINDSSAISEDIWSFCCVPCISQMFFNGFESLNLTTTLTFANAFLHFFARLVKKDANKLFSELVEFTWQYFHKENELCIEIKPEELNCALIGSLFITLPIQARFGIINCHKSHILHILVHEFLIALKAISLEQTDFESFFEDALKKKQFYVVIKFICGLCYENFLTDLKGVHLPKILEKCLQEHFLGNVARNKQYVTTKIKSFAPKCNLTQAQQCCEYLYEMQDIDTTRCVAKYLDFSKLENNKAVSYVQNVQHNGKI